VGRKDKKVFARIDQLMQTISRTPFSGIGKPEPLKHEFSGFWSRRINHEHRLIYRVSENKDIEIASCKYHYKTDGEIQRRSDRTIEQ
jgi:toxin YoeB